MKTELPESSYRELLLWLLRKRRRFKVVGMSMVPLLKPGEQILVDPQAYLDSLPEINDVVVAIHPSRSDLQIIKRVALVQEDGSCFLKGDNPGESTDSRSFGFISGEQILGKVTSRLP
jgi:nickel-type superoxide dismutase maturation protease